MQLLFGNVFALSMGHVNRSRPQQHRGSPIAERRNVRGEFRHHGFNARNGPQLYKWNLQDELNLGEAGHAVYDFLAHSVGGTNKAIQQLRASMIRDYVRRAPAFNDPDVES